MHWKRSAARDYLMMTVGVCLMAVAGSNIYDSMGLVTGGVTGLAIIIKKLFGLPLWLTNTVINIPLFVAGYFVCGKKFIGRTIYATMLTSLVFMILPTAELIPNEDLFLGSVFGGILMGLGGGLVFIAHATTGGTDLLAAILRKLFFRHLSLPQVMQVLDGIIVLIGLGIFGITNSLYAIVSIYIFTKISDSLIDGMHFAKAVYIISPKTQEIAARILSELDRGVTGIAARGMYSDEKREMLYCVLSNRETTTLKDLVSEIDPQAFVIVSDVREALGEGFTREKVYGEQELKQSI